MMSNISLCDHFLSIAPLQWNDCCIFSDWIVCIFVVDFLVLYSSNKRYLYSLSDMWLAKIFTSPQFRERKRKQTIKHDRQLNNILQGTSDLISTDKFWLKIQRIIRNLMIRNNNTAPEGQHTLSSFSRLISLWPSD